MAVTASATALVSRGSLSSTTGSRVSRSGRGAGPAAGGGASLAQAATHRRMPTETTRRGQDRPNAEIGVIGAVMVPEDSQTPLLGNRPLPSRDPQPTTNCRVYDKT